jgi:competence protein ComEC
LKTGEHVVRWGMCAMACLLGVALALSAPVGGGVGIGVGIGLVMVVAVILLLRVACGPALWAKRWVAWGGMWLVVWLLACLSTLWRVAWRAQEQWPRAWLDQDVPVELVVTALPRALMGGGVRFDARLVKTPVPPGVQALPTHIRLTADARAGMGEVQPGQHWRLRVRLHPPDGLANPGAWDTEGSLFGQGVRAAGQVRARAQVPVLLHEPAMTDLSAAMDCWRLRVRTAIMQRVPDRQAAGVLMGLVVGDQAAMSPDDWDVFRRTGVAHVVSISGTHIAMLGCLFAWLMRRLWGYWHQGVHRWPAPVVARWSGVGVSLVYAWMAGWGVPAQRTVLMMLVMAALQSGGRRWPWPLTCLFTAVLVVLLDPWALQQAGFWLSYIAVCILMSSGRSPATDHVSLAIGAEPSWSDRWWGPARDAALEMVRTQWRISLALMPLAVVCFQQVSVVGLLANLVAIPVFTVLITPMALLGVLVHPVWAVAAALTQWAVQMLAGLASWHGAVINTPLMPAWVSALAVLVGLLLAWPVPWLWRLYVLPCLLPLLYVPQSWRLLPLPSQGQFTLLAADVGQGTAVLVRTAHHHLLFDTGARWPSGQDMGQMVLLPLLHALGVTKLDALVISHQDNDHVGGAQRVLMQMPTDQLISSLAQDHALRQNLADGMPPIPHQACMAGQSWTWDGVRFDVLHPTAADYAQRHRLPPNALSCVVRVSTQGPHAASALLTGDIESAQEAALLKRAITSSGDSLRSTVLIVPHHGSDTSSTRPFLAAVAPMQAVVQVARRNRYGHPAPEVMARYQDMSLPVIGSPSCGAYIWHSQDGLSRSVNRASMATPVLGDCWRNLSGRQAEADGLPPEP